MAHACRAAARRLAGEERARVLPVLEALAPLKDSHDFAISIDTCLQNFFGATKNNCFARDICAKCDANGEDERYCHDISGI